MIGNQLGARLVRDGHFLVVLSREGEAARARLSYPCEIWKWGSQDPLPRQSLDGVDAVIHLAGENIAAKPWSRRRKQQLRESRLDGLRRLTEALATRTQPLQVFLSASAVGYYGDRGDEELTESSTPGKGFLAELCEEWERLAREVHSRRRVTGRFGVVVSPTGGFIKEIAARFLRFGATPLGSGRQHLSWIHIDDLVEFFAQALKQDSIEGTFNLVSPETITNEEMTRQMAEVLGVSMRRAVPRAVLHMALGELASSLLGSAKVIPARLLEKQFSFKHSAFASALRAAYPASSGEVFTAYRVWVPATPEKLWEFLADPKSLERLFPQPFHVKLRRQSPPQMEPGTLLHYRLRLYGLPFRWVSKIEEWNPPQRFVDVQVRGPYQKWIHQHEISALGKGSLLQDQIRFQLPLGGFGRGLGLARAWKEVDEIFRFRNQQLTEIFYSR